MVTRRCISVFCERFRFARAARSATWLIFMLCSIACSLCVDASYSVRARSRLLSSCRICAITCCACACFALTEGSPVAVPATAHAAARAMTSTGACRLRTLFTSSNGCCGRRTGGAGTSQVREASKGFGRSQPAIARKAAAISSRYCRKLLGWYTHKVAQLWQNAVVRSAPRAHVPSMDRGVRRLCSRGVRCSCRCITAARDATRTGAASAALVVCDRYTAAYRRGAAHRARRRGGACTTQRDLAVAAAHCDTTHAHCGAPASERQPSPLVQAGRRERACSRPRRRLARRRGDAARLARSCRSADAHAPRRSEARTEACRPTAPYGARTASPARRRGRRSGAGDAHAARSAREPGSAPHPAANAG